MQRTTPRRLTLPVFLLLTGLTACGGGGEEEDGAVADFSATDGALVYQFGSFNQDLVASGAESFAAKFLYDGVYDLATDSYTITTQQPYQLKTGGLFGDLDVFVLDAVEISASGRATAGRIEVTRGSGPATERIEITVDTSIPGVQLTYDDGTGVLGPFAYGWEELAELFGTGAPPYEEIASYVFRATSLLLEHYALTIEAFSEAFEQADRLESAGPGVAVPITDGCRTFPGSGAQGTLGLSWNDVDADGEISNGDELELVFASCWNDRGDGTGSQYTGTVRLVGISFLDEPFTTGALVVVDLAETRTRETGGVVEVVPGGDVATTGEFSAHFYDPNG